MTAIRRLEELQQQNKPVHSNRNFGVFQEVHTSSEGVSFTRSQGINLHTPSHSKPSFSIYSEPTNDLPAEAVDHPWTPFKSTAAQSKENERSLHKHT